MKRATTLIILSWLYSVNTAGAATPEEKETPQTNLSGSETFCNEEIVGCDVEAAEDLIDYSGIDTFQEAYISIYFDNRYVAETLALIARDDTLVKIHYDEIVDTLSEHLPEDFLTTLADEQDHLGWVPVELLDYYNPLFDSNILSVHFSIPPCDRAAKTIDYSPYHGQGFCDPAAVAKKSGYLNLRNVFTRSNGNADYILDGDIGIRAYDWVFESRFDIRQERTSAFEHRDIKFIRDFPCRMTRFMIGEDQSFQPYILSSDRIYGIKYSSEFRLQPNLITDPVSEFSFLLERESLVEIIVNGEEKDLRRLPAGPYDVRNLRLTEGFNEVVLKITDDLGQNELLSFNRVSGPTLLCKGMKQFAYSVGVRGAGRNIQGPVIGSILYRKGLYNQLTGSVEARADSRQQGIGVGIDFATRFFYGSAYGAATSSHNGSGAACRATLSKRYEDWRGNIRYDVYQEKFLSQTQALTTSRVRESQYIQLIRYLPESWGTLTLSFINERRWRNSPQRRLDAMWERRVGNRWYLQFTGSHQDFRHPRQELRGIVSYVLVGEKVTRSHHFRHSPDLRSLRTTLSRGTSKECPVNWRLTHYHDMPRNNNESDTINMTLRHESPRLSKHYSFWVDEIGHVNEFRHNVNIAFSLAYADGHFGVGRPINDSFVMVATTPSIGELAVRKLGSREHSWVASPSMPAVVPNFNAYQPRSLIVESDSHGIDWSQNNFVVLPSYRSATIISPTMEDDANGARVVTGILRDRQGDVVSLKAILIHNTGHPDDDDHFTFTNHDGFFRATGMITDTEYILEALDAPELIYRLSVPSSSNVNQVIDAGELQVDKDLLLLGPDAIE